MRSIKGFTKFGMNQPKLNSFNKGFIKPSKGFIQPYESFTSPLLNL